MEYAEKLKTLGNEGRDITEWWWTDAVTCEFEGVESVLKNAL